MKQLKNIITFCTLIILSSCGPIVTFDEPQPTDTDNLSKFPKRIQGQFQSLRDNSVLNLNDKTITRTYDFEVKVHINQLDSTYRLSGDTVINIQDNDSKVMRREGDSLIEHIFSSDTLFEITDDGVLKKYKGYFFLNTNYGKEWGVQKLSFQRGQLTISSISTKEDIELLKEISESITDSLPYQFKPTKNQFKKFVKADGFSDSEIFVKIK